MTIQRAVFVRDDYTCQYCDKKAKWILSNGAGVTQVFEKKPTFKNRFRDFWRGWEDPIPFEIDHVIPICRGGNNEIENLKLSCRPCNRRKNCGVV